MSAKSLKLRRLLPCFMGIIVDVFGLTVAPPLLTNFFLSTDFLSPAISEQLRYTYFSLAIVIYPLAMFFGASFMGDLSDMIGRKKVLLTCMVLFALGFSLTGVGIGLSGLFLLFLGRMISGIAAASFATTMAAIADVSSPENQAHYLGIAVATQVIGFALGPLMAAIFSNSHILPFFDLKFPFFFSTALAVIAFLWLLTKFNESFTRNNAKKIHPMRAITVFIEAWKHKKVRPLIGVFFLHQVAIVSFFQLILIFFQKHYRYTSFGLGFVLFVFGAISAVAALCLPFFTKRYQSEWIATFSLAGLALSLFAVAAISQWEILIWVLLLPLALTASLAWSTMLLTFSHAVTKQSQGWVMGITGSIVAISFILIGLIINLAFFVGVMPIIATSGVLLVFAALIMRSYCQNHQIDKSL